MAAQRPQRLWDVTDPSFAVIAPVLQHSDTVTETTAGKYDRMAVQCLEWLQDLNDGRPSHLPASPQELAAYAVHLAQQRESAKTVDEVWRAMAHFNAKRLWEPYSQQQRAAFDHVVKALRRELPGPPKEQAPPLTADILVAMVRGMRESLQTADPMQRLQTKQHIAMLCLGWFSLLRGSELLNLQRKELNILETSRDGKPHYEVVFGTNTKTSFRVSRIPAIDEEIDAATAVMDYVHDLNEFLAQRFGVKDFHKLGDMPLFPVLKRISARFGAFKTWRVQDLSSMLRTMLRQHVPALGPEAIRQFSSHSLRRGAAVTLLRQHASFPAILHAGHWVSACVADYLEVDDEAFCSDLEQAFQRAARDASLCNASGAAQLAHMQALAQRIMARTHARRSVMRNSLALPFQVNVTARAVSAAAHGGGWGGRDRR